MISSNIILTEQRLDEVVRALLRSDTVFYDLEAVGQYRGVPHLNDLTWMGLASDGICVSVPFGHTTGDNIVGSLKRPTILSNGKIIANNIDVYDDAPPQIRRDVVMEMTRPLFLDERIVKVSHGNYDHASMPKYIGAPVANIECNIVLDWLLNENRHAYGLKQRIKQLWGVEYDDKNVGKEVEKHPFSTVARYLFLDTKYGFLQYRKNRPGIEAEGLEQVYELEKQILELMVDMRQRGARVDVDTLLRLRETLTTDLGRTEAALYAAAGREFNINSVRQKATILFGPRDEGGQGLKAWKLTDGGKLKKERSQELLPTDYSTDDEHLESFPKNPVAASLRQYQDTSKLLNTYVVSWLGEEADEDRPWYTPKPSQIYGGRIHADFVQYGTKTGRFSCRAPNLQNIPRGDTEHGSMLRHAWIADDGWLDIVADYGQIELVMLAHFIGEGAMFDGFQMGVDPHTMTAALVFGVAPEDVIKDQRQAAKAINFAVVYGAGPAKVASMIGQSKQRAIQILDKHEMEFPEIYAYKAAVIRQARKNGYLRTLLGRKRRIPELNWSDQGMRMYAERQAFNSKIQGSAADLIKLAMVRTHQNLKGMEGAHIALTVHDELVLTAPAARAEDCAAALKDGMAGPSIQELIRVPLKADVVIGPSWGDCK